MSLYIGLDIGGTKFLVGAADETGTILRRRQEPTPRNLDEGIALLKAMTDTVAQGEPILAFGAAAGGPLDWERGIISPLHQPEWNDVPLKAIFEDAYHAPLYVDVDTNVAALGEYRFGGEAAERMLYLTMSTGMGGGYLVNGQIYRGMGGAHPEVAHQTIAYRTEHPERVQCDCGAGECLEALVSGSGIRRVYGKPAELLTDDEWAEVAYNLGQGLRNLAAILAPDLIVLGGGVAVGGGDRLIPRARQVMEAHLKIAPVPQLRLSRLGYDTALLGCIALAMQGFS